ncbi:hypothetical protein MDA_GLEAN10024733 [Myotis davidii]|uniref:Uncharacterized protein n=1 Tax=Myotis davidii TaxID=225400 RepID=L5LXD3_MYODS|nr:hypothetical protein MDA_GLEAN10024733 [Myotis davidii]
MLTGGPQKRSPKGRGRGAPPQSHRPAGSWETGSLAEPGAPVGAHGASGPDCSVGRCLEASPPTRVQRAQVWPPPGLISSAACWARAASSQGLCLALAEETGDAAPTTDTGSPPAPAPSGDQASLEAR